MREDAPAEFAEAIAFDEAHRENPMAERHGSTADKLYIYKAKRTKPMPLEAADLVDHAGREKRSPNSLGQQLPLLCDAGFCHV